MVPQHAMSCTPYWLLGIMLGATTAVVDIVLEELRLWMFPTETDDITLQSVDVLCGCHRSHPTSDEKVRAAVPITTFVESYFVPKDPNFAAILKTDPGAEVQKSRHVP